ncbi:MAG: hypothetical protein ABI960_09225 [Candidatus Eisenbacteria bacterium]
MDPNQSLARIHAVGRMVMFLVLAILAAAAVYAVSIALINWSAIGV